MLPKADYFETIEWDRTQSFPQLLVGGDAVFRSVVCYLPLATRSSRKRSPSHPTIRNLGEWPPSGGRVACLLLSVKSPFVLRTTILTFSTRVAMTILASQWLGCRVTHVSLSLFNILTAVGSRCYCDNDNIPKLCVITLSYM